MSYKHKSQTRDETVRMLYKRNPCEGDGCGGKLFALDPVYLKIAIISLFPFGVLDRGYNLGSRVPHTLQMAVKH